MFRFIDKTKVPMGVPQERGAFARIKHPTAPFTYYETKEAKWTTIGYTVWSIAEQKARFGPVDDRGYDTGGRLWEFFGYEIPLYPEGDKT